VNKKQKGLSDPVFVAFAGWRLRQCPMREQFRENSTIPLLLL